MPLSHRRCRVEMIGRPIAEGVHSNMPVLQGGSARGGGGGAGGASTCSAARSALREAVRVARPARHSLTATSVAAAAAVLRRTTSACASAACPPAPCNHVSVVAGCHRVLHHDCIRPVPRHHANTSQ